MSVRRYKVVLEFDREAGAWVTYVPALDNISTFGDSRDEALSNTRELIEGYIEAAGKEGMEIPAATSETELVDVEVAIA